jgi:preprotein translocase SecE subunit
MANNSGGKDGGKTPTAAVPIPRSKRGFKGFVTEVGREMKKVSWPTKAETNRLTGVVFAVCFILAVVLMVMSYAFDTLISILTKGGLT